MAITDIPRPCSNIVEFYDCKRVAACSHFGIDLRAGGYIDSTTTVVSVVWNEPTGLTMIDEGVIAPGKVWVAYGGGVADTDYVATALVTCSNGEQPEFVITISVH